MMKKGLILLLGLTLALTACAKGHSLPYRAWFLSFSAVPYMEVWVEEAQVTDVAGRTFRGYEVGIPSIVHRGNPAGWENSSGYGAGRYVLGAALPKKIYVRWQSLVEPQTYEATLNIPDSVRKLMLAKGPPNPAYKHPAPGAYYYNRLNIGLAPGGWIKVWLGGSLEDPLPVMCVKAKIDPVGPYEGKSHGKYRPLTKKAAAYMAAHPVIPYNSWDCKKHLRRTRHNSS